MATRRGCCGNKYLNSGVELHNTGQQLNVWRQCPTERTIKSEGSGRDENGRVHPKSLERNLRAVHCQGHCAETSGPMKPELLGTGEKAPGYKGWGAWQS